MNSYFNYGGSGAEGTGGGGAGWCIVSPGFWAPLLSHFCQLPGVGLAGSASAPAGEGEGTGVGENNCQRFLTCPNTQVSYIPYRPL